MEKVFRTLCVVLVFITACNTQKKAASPKAEHSVQKFPFSLSVVPETSHGEPFGSTIEMEPLRGLHREHQNSVSFPLSSNMSVFMTTGVSKGSS
jgi:hypothetical protein